MINKIIYWCYHNQFITFSLVLVFTFFGFLSMINTPLDAIPDLSDVQVIVFTEWPGQSPDIVEDQVTYPIVSRMIAAPKVKVARGSSFFGLSFVYIIFEDGTDMYWARSRVLEYLSGLQGALPKGVTPELGPDATGVGWGFQYVLVDHSGKSTLQEMRGFQDWYLRYWLESVPGVAEVATVGGYDKQYQVTLDPERLRAYKIPLKQVVKAIQASNNDVGGSVVEMAQTEYMVRGRGYVKRVEDLDQVVVAIRNNVPIRIRELGRTVLGPNSRRGTAEWNGQGEVVGGIVVVRFGEDVLGVIERVKKKIESIKGSLPPGVEIKTAYDRSDLIEHSVENLRGTLIEESIIVALVCLLFLLHLPSALVAILTLPIAVLLAFIPMKMLGLSANIMSLGGIAIAVGAMVDAAIVIIENAHKRIEHEPDRPRKEVMVEAAQEVARPIFFSLLILTVSFLPVFSLQAQEGRLFSPLAYTKTFSLGFAAILSITVVPMFLLWFIRGKIPAEKKNPVNRFLIWIYEPVVRFVLKWPKTMLLVIAFLGVGIGYPAYRSLGSEFMPPLNEGTILFMPTYLPGVSITEAKRILQLQDKLIMEVPEVLSVFGKGGRARTPTDPAPLSMVETTIRLKPVDQWRPGMTWEKLIDELDKKVKMPGVTNAWTMPIKGRIDMLTTGIRTPIGIKVFGPSLREIGKIGKKLESILTPIRGTRSVYAERVLGGHFVDFDVDRFEAAQYGLNVEDVELMIQTAVGGMDVGRTVEGPERYTINIRYFRDYRNGLDRLKKILVATPTGALVPIGQLAHLVLRDGPPQIRDENGSISGWVYVDVADRDLGSYIKEAQEVVRTQLKMPPGYSLLWSGQYEYMQRANKRLALVLPVTLLAILFLLFLNFRDFFRVAMVACSLPFALVGGFVYLWILGFNLSVAVAVGFIALSGVAAETGVIMIVYLDEAWQKWRAEKGDANMTEEEVSKLVIWGAAQRVRPKMMTVTAIIAGLLPIMWSSGSGADVMQRIAAPMIGGMVSSTVLTLIIIPIIYEMWGKWQVRRMLKHGTPLPDVGMEIITAESKKLSSAKPDASPTT